MEKVKIDCKVVRKYTTGFWIFKSYILRLEAERLNPSTFEIPVSEAEFMEIPLWEKLRVSFCVQPNGKLKLFRKEG